MDPNSSGDRQRIMLEATEFHDIEIEFRETTKIVKAKSTMEEIIPMGKRPLPSVGMLAERFDRDLKRMKPVASNSPPKIGRFIPNSQKSLSSFVFGGKS